jgi:hypothetical protein
MRQDSIRDYNLHSSYPLHLNQQGLYQGHPPNICQCMHAKVTQHVATAGCQVANSVRNNGRNPLQPGQERGRARNQRVTGDINASIAPHTPYYCPALMNPPTEGNYRWTQ